jgi:hypothetical protein
MIYEDWIKYKPSKKGTSLTAEFNYQEEVRLKGDINKYIKKEIQNRLDIENNDEFRDYLKKVEGLVLNCTYLASEGNGLGRRIHLNPNKKKLTLKVEVITEQQVPKEDMLNWDALDSFIAEGKYPEKAA